MISTGGTCEAWLGGRGNTATSINTRSPFNADLFGSFCYTFQHGKFRELFGDLTRFDARLDISSVSAIAKRVFKNKSSSVNCADSRSSPSLNLIFQQQVSILSHFLSLFHYIKENLFKSPTLPSLSPFHLILVLDICCFCVFLVYSECWLDIIPNYLKCINYREFEISK